MSPKIVHEVKYKNMDRLETEKKGNDGPTQRGEI